MATKVSHCMMNLQRMETFQKMQYLQIITLSCAYWVGKYSKRCIEEYADNFYDALYGQQGYECFLSNVQALKEHQEFAIFQKEIELFVEQLPKLYSAYKFDKSELEEFDLLPKKKVNH